MTAATVHAMPGFAKPASDMAALLGLRIEPVDVHRFPDGESLVKVGPTAPTAILFCSLDRPNDKLVEIMLAASALRDGGAARLVLVAPYMCYMRQDAAFEKGQAVSQRVVGALLAGLFDRIVTVDPHLHRTNDIADVFPGAEADALSAAPLLSAFLEDRDDGRRPVLVGPDEESRQWVEAVAGTSRLDVLTAEKTRQGDADVTVAIPDLDCVAGQPVWLVDDMISTGATLARAAEVLLTAGAASVDALTVHCLCDEEALSAMHRAGIDQIHSTDSVAHPTNSIALAPLLAAALRSETGG